MIFSLSKALRRIYLHAYDVFLSDGRAILSLFPTTVSFTHPSFPKVGYMDSENQSVLLAWGFGVPSRWYLRPFDLLAWFVLLGSFHLFVHPIPSHNFVRLRQGSCQACMPLSHGITYASSSLDWLPVARH